MWGHLSAKIIPQHVGLIGTEEQQCDVRVEGGKYCSCVTSDFQ